LDIDLISDIVKVTAALIGGSLGISSVVVDYKQPKGGINRWGKLVIAGIALSTIQASIATL
jgi:hypothetical protein